ncbi:hypothetical protein BH24ACT11_BH24ACT11_09890 [soil metagenome]
MTRRLLRCTAALGAATIALVVGCTGESSAPAAEPTESPAASTPSQPPAPPAESTDAAAPSSSDLPTELPTDDEPVEEPTDQVPCTTDVTEVKIPAVLSNLSYPDRTIVYDVEVLGENGIRVTGVTDLRFSAAREQMRIRYSKLPFEIVDEDRGLTAFAANWTGPSITGRWLVTDISETCPGNTEVRILWTSDG